MSEKSPHKAQTNSTTALLLVDVQNDFCEGGALACSGGTALAARLPELARQYHTVIASKDWHIDPGEHFSDTPDWTNSWPVHCRANTMGAELRTELSPITFNALFHKGAYHAAYSAFEGKEPENQLSLTDWLHAHHITAIDIAGIALDYCVSATALDAIKNNFITTLLSDYTVSITSDKTPQVLAKLHKAGVKIV